MSKKKHKRQSQERAILGNNTSFLPTEPPPKGSLPRLGSGPNTFTPGKSRQTIPQSTLHNFGSPFAWLPRNRQIVSLEAIDLTSLTAEEIVEILMDASPEFSMAVWNVLRLCNSGWELSVKDKNDDKDDEKAYAVCMETLRRLNPLGGGFDTILDQLHMSAFTQGASSAEAPPTPGLSGIEDLYPVSPYTIRFHWHNSGTDENPRWQLAMEQFVQGISIQPRWLNPAQFFYKPVDPVIDLPYGRSPVVAAIGAIVFWLDVLRDLRRALHMNAWGRLDIQVNEEAISNRAPPESQEDPEVLKSYLNSVLDDIEHRYSQMEPDDSFIHFDTVKVTAVDASGKVFDTHPLLHSIEGLIIRGLKQLPTLMGGAESRGAGQLGTLEYQIYSTGIQTFQKKSAAIVEAALELDLRLKGKQNRVHMLWNEIRTTDELKSEQALALRIQNQTRMRDEGYIDQVEASMNVVGHMPDQAKPPPVGKIATGDRPSPPPMPTNQQDPMNNQKPVSGSIPSVGQSTGEGGDQNAAPQPAPSRAALDALTAVYLERSTPTVNGSH